MGAEPDYSDEIAREIDDEIRRVIEEAHELALRACSASTWTQLHRISQILIERETIDHDQFERLLAGEAEATIFPPEAAPPAVEPQPEEEPKREPQPQPRPFPLPGATMQPPPPDPAKSSSLRRNRASARLRSSTGRVLALEARFPRPSVMGVVNVTPDSFSDGGVNLDPDVAAARARRLVAEGAALVDIGGESTRPGSDGVSLDEELRRVVPCSSASAATRRCRSTRRKRRSHGARSSSAR